MSKLKQCGFSLIDNDTDL